MNTVDAQTSLNGSPGGNPLLKVTSTGTAAAVRGVAGAKTIRRSFGNWTATFSGTFDYEWSEPSWCPDTGDGSVRATFSGELGEFEVSSFGLVANTDRVSGSVTLTDNRTVNPPQPPDFEPPCHAMDKSGCGTRGYDPAFFELGSTTSEQRPPLHMTMDLSGMLNAFFRADDGDCYDAGLQDFGYFPGNSPHDSDTGDYTTFGVLVGPPLATAGFARRRAFTVTAQDTHRSVEFPGILIATGRRSVTVTFTPVEDRLRAEELAASPVAVLYRGVFRARLFPPWATARSFEWQMRRSNQSRWTTLGMTPTPSFPFTVRLAGHFKIRAIAHGASSGGIPRTVVTGEKPLEVRFPTRDQILTDQGVNSFIRDAWAQTLSLATPQSRREVGFWISLDTCAIPREHRRYHPTPRILGPPVGPRDDATVQLGPRPPDKPPNPPAVIGCATYMVASFHTHTPTTYREPLGGSRPVGPSRKDKTNARQKMVPGVVFDYIADPPRSMRIPFGYPMHNPAQDYRYGEVRRPTPQT